MTINIRLIFFFFSILLINGIQGQNRILIRGNESKIYSILDTSSVKKPYISLNVRWINDTIKIQKWAYDLDIESAIDAFKKSTGFNDWSPSEEKKGVMLKRKKNAAYNCYSSALSHFFKFHNLNFSSIFNDSTSIKDWDSFDKILKSTFTLTEELSVKTAKKYDFKNGYLIVFRNRNNKPIHAFYYYNDTFYSKNGQWEEKKFQKLKKILKTYFDTTVIQIYGLNESSIVGFLLTQ